MEGSGFGKLRRTEARLVAQAISFLTQHVPIGGLAVANLFCSLKSLLIMELTLMKRSLTYCCGAFAAATALAATAAHAAVFIGSSADITDFADGSEVSTRGQLVDAVNLFNANVGGVGVSTTINGVLFKGTQPGAFHEGAEPFAQASFVYHGGEGYADSGLWSSGGAYDTLADSQIYNVDNGNVNTGDGFGIVNLTPGAFYELQVFMLDDRSGINKTFPLQIQQAAFTGNFDELDSNTPAVEIGYMPGITIGGNGVTQANGEIATLVFSIDAGFNGLLVNSWDGGAYNGMQLRLLPEPTGAVIAGAAMIAAACKRRRNE
jgi:hypothetical protein